MKLERAIEGCLWRVTEKGAVEIWSDTPHAFDWVPIIDASLHVNNSRYWSVAIVEQAIALRKEWLTLKYAEERGAAPIELHGLDSAPRAPTKRSK